ncbi:hypothetical protein [Mycolicibacterium llatzerense]|uniref:hypothetical protein n=1 Tax=Mycolicibacterium llatzerense TaxID=280871 RepID=UPI0021B54395|nr:hypothetical protein [Mycolicibacterium llatzerense]MCT7361310.1 hypothetical protein [Mycolicibacterium llatzerense]
MATFPFRGCPKGNPNCKGHRHFRGGGFHDGATECAEKITADEFPDLIGLGHGVPMRSWYRIYRAKSHGAEVTYQFVGHGDHGPTSKPGNAKGQPA